MKFLLTTTVLVAAIVLPTAAKADALSESGHDWSGFYAGVQAGYGMFDGSSAYDQFNNQYFVLRSSADLDGLFGGVHGGYNVQTGNGLLLGLEADLNFGDQAQSGVLRYINGSESYSAFDYYDINASGSGRLRLGWTCGDFLPFVTAGLAIADFDTGFDAFEGPYSAAGSEIALGYTLGAGAEFALNKNTRIRAEYRYADYGTTEVLLTTDVSSPATTPTEIDLKSHAVSLGLSFAF